MSCRTDDELEDLLEAVSWEKDIFLNTAKKSSVVTGHFCPVGSQALLLPAPPEGCATEKFTRHEKTGLIHTSYTR